MKINKPLLCVPVFLIFSIIIFLIYDFILIEDVTITHKSGNYVVVLSEDMEGKNIIDEMNASEKEIVELLKQNSINSKVSTVFYPDLPAFVYYKNSERRKPYHLKVANDAFFQNLKIQHPETNTLYRMVDEERGTLKLRLNTIDSSKPFKEVTFELYEVTSKDIVDENDLPNFNEMFTYMKFGDYITLDTFSSIVENVYDKNTENYPYGEFASFQIFIKSENGDITNSILEILPEKYFAEPDIEIEKENVFDKWQSRLKIGLSLICVVVVLEILLLKKYKTNKIDL